MNQIPKSRVSRTLALLGAFALLASMMPIKASASAVGQEATIACCTNDSSGADNDTCGVPAPVPDQPLGDSDCCPAGCDDCYLRCCLGITGLTAGPYLLSLFNECNEIEEPEVNRHFPPQDRLIEHPPKA